MMMLHGRRNKYLRLLSEVLQHAGPLFAALPPALLDGQLGLQELHLRLRVFKDEDDDDDDYDV